MVLFRKKHEVRLWKRVKILFPKCIPFRNFYCVDHFLVPKEYEMVCILEVLGGRGHKGSETVTILEVRIGTVLEIK